MAVELGHFIADQLARLPENHPDRAFIAGLGTVVGAYTEAVPTEDLPVAAAGAPTEAAAEPAPTAPAATDEERTPAQDRVRVNGRLGAAPAFRETPKSKQRVATFPLAERDDAGQTTWHRVVAFNKPGRPLADKVEQLGLAKGSAVEVVGYRHEREVRTRTVETRALKPHTITEIYAVAVRKH